MAATLSGGLSGDRRQFERIAIDRRSLVRGRVRPGRDVRVLELSRGGAVVQANARLLPGSQVDLQLKLGDWSWGDSAHVIRCQVAALAADQHVRYRAVLQFHRPLDEGCQRRWEETLRGEREPRELRVSSARHG